MPRDTREIYHEDKWPQRKRDTRPKGHKWNAGKGHEGKEIPGQHDTRVKDAIGKAQGKENTKRAWA